LPTVIKYEGNCDTFPIGVNLHYNRFGQARER
jgi:hypothetical protein